MEPLNPVKSDDAVQELKALREELRELTSAESRAFVSWELRVRSALARAFGDHHHITEQFGDIYWTSPNFGGDLASDLR